AYTRNRHSSSGNSDSHAGRGHAATGWSESSAGSDDTKSDAGRTALGNAESEHSKQHKPRHAEHNHSGNDNSGQHDACEPWYGAAIYESGSDSPEFNASQFNSRDTASVRSR